MQTDINYVFVQAVGEVLAAEANVQVNRGPHEVQHDTYVTNDITVLFSLVGDLSGVAILSLSRIAAQAIIYEISGNRLVDFDKLAHSGICELGNLIIGRARTKMAELGLDTDISVPTLIVGKGSRISTLNITRLVTPLETESGTLHLSLALRESSDSLPCRAVS